MNWEKLRELLEAEQYPHRYVHKFIGKKTQVFMSAVSRLEARFPRATRVGERETSDKSGSAFIALTYELVANDSDEIIELLQHTGTLPDLKLIL